QAAMPLALGGVLIGWLLAWTWQWRAGNGPVAPFDLRPLGDPIQLWQRFQIAIDPARLYTGNVAGPLGVTSFGLVALCALLLGFSRQISWPYVLAFFAPPAALALLTRQP